MYGYVRPVKGELKIAEFERFRSVYCGLCHTLSRRYGPLSRFLVNYDFTFLAMLLAGPEQVRTCPRRCAAHPLRPTECLVECGSLQTAADMTVVLGWWKLADGARDGRGARALSYKLACLALKRAYRKAAARRPAFATAVQTNLRQLQALERDRCPSLDQAADKFAAILRSISTGEATPSRQRITGELLYHLGRIIYILDAVDDLAEDIASDSYNPLRYRFQLMDGRLSAEDERILRAGMQLSHNAISGAYALMEENPYSGILTNIIYLGLPAATQAVFAGGEKWNARAKLQRERSSI